MKILAITCCALVGCAFHTNDASPDAGARADSSIDVIADAAPMREFLRETSDGNVVPGAAIYCSSGAPTIDDAWYRAFRLSDFGIATGFYSYRIHFTAETAKNATITLAIYAYAGPIGAATLDTTQLVLLSTVTGQVQDAGGPSDIWVPRNIELGAGSTFVVEISTTSSAGSWFHLGANAAAETRPSYHASTRCGETTPTAHPGHSFIIDTDGIAY